ncbi:protein POLLEN DEFECTIVE IN GUIDANCE 1 [Diospyros lotus]|uniref:protein POLLEN DEFECTIVE IN GUIDANCE 1 n=1 Tax=Diospyros lotus TaxID=55363 RepID=UPI00225B92E9|nr:protein POLLEN DEFECTIVE IN GUIDANCE 1 [Diospyros lotus]
MESRSRARNLSFEVLAATTFDANDVESIYPSLSDLLPRSDADSSKLSPSESKSGRRKRKSKASKKKNRTIESSISENGVLENGCSRGELEVNSSVSQTVVCEEVTVREESVCTVVPVRGSGFQNEQNSEGFLAGELRQRSVVSSAGSDDALSRFDENAKEESGSNKLDSSAGKQLQEPNVSGHRKLETAESLDWKSLMAEDPNHAFSLDKSPVKCFIEEMYSGNSLQSTTTLGNDKERERVYDTIFRLPWRCELLIDVGLFVCLDSFLSLLTIMPTRILMAFCRLFKTRQFERPSASELSDFGCFIVLACGVALLEQIDISLIYHMIRGQGTIKLYVVYNVLEIFDKLCQSFGGDVLQTLFSSAEGLANCTSESRRYWIWRFISDEALAVASSIVHSFILLAQAITLSTCIVAHNNALLALLVSNNFAEIKSNVFKRFSKDNIHSLVYYDSVERFHISAFVLFILAQNILEAEGPWFESFLFNALMVYLCEMMIDIIKHSFIAKFNDIKPIAFSEFLEDLCKQTLNIETGNGKKNLTFVPLAPACVVIRVLAPVFAARLPYNPLPWRLFWILVLSAMTFVMLASLKLMIGMGLKKHAKWYIKRCQKRKLHSD